MRKNVEFRLPANCRIGTLSGGEQLVLLPAKKDLLPGQPRTAFIVDITAIHRMHVSEAAKMYPTEATRCSLEQKYKNCEICCIELGDNRQIVDDLVLFRPLNQWTERQFTSTGELVFSIGSQ
jgi:hypothetical protein